MSRNIISGMLRGGLYTRVVGRRIRYFHRLPSTMDEAARQAEDGAEEGTIIFAEEQTAGRGRFQRTWVSASGNLYLSIVLRPSIQSLQSLSMLSGVAVVRAIRKSTGIECVIKWPNDVRVKGKKVSGILVENALVGDSVQYAVVGIGINVALDPSTVDELSKIATSLNMEIGREVDRESLLRHLLQEMDGLYRSLGPPGANGQPQDAADAHWKEEWRGLLETLGREVEVRWQHEVYTGFAEGVDEAGNLLLRLGDGTLLTLPAGEVTSQGSGKDR